jgi:hypothetical protein
MDILIGTSLLVAIVLLGALITAGNERQRKALDGIREQVEAWAQEDILIKREKVARSIQVQAPLAWLEKTAAGVLGQAPGIMSATPWEKDGLLAMIAVCKDGSRLIFTPVPYDRFLKSIRLNKRGALAQAETSVLGDRPEKVAHYDLSVLTSGMFFDIEAAQAWQALSGQALPSKRLTMFELAPRAGVQVKKTGAHSIGDAR